VSDKTMCPAGWRVRLDYLRTQPGDEREIARALYQMHLQDCQTCRSYVDAGHAAARAAVHPEFDPRKEY